MDKLSCKAMAAHVPAPGQTPEWAWFLHAIPSLALLVSTPQDPYYHAEGDVWIHTRMVIEALMRGPDYIDGSDEERFILFYAALLHDIAKPATTVIDPDSGRIGQPGHSKRGAIDARILCWHAGVPFAVREHICRIITVHQLPFFALAGNKNGQSAEFLIRKLSHELDLRLLSAVAQADMEGRCYEKKDDCLVGIELFREMARDEGCYGAPKAFADPHTRLSYMRGAGIAPDFVHHQNAGSRVTVMSGLPASGKNHWVAANRARLPVVSIDDAREELGLRHGANEGAVAHRAVDFAKEMLRGKAPFVWNTTHLSAQMRKKTLDLLYAYDAEVELVYLEQPPQVIFKRNTQRDTSLPNKAIERMLFKWEVPLPTEAHVVHYFA
ncbi:AAA family ATPase [Massilia antarctica]|uniref:AAA family ATPase n=1 Tax=Massilia antarctica TaxID=2765360 RepID=A0AA49A6L7_9BURK|nr:AAA family ATPase [Massilia antarctica]QPI48394.1 AAA family ATPase [Massilia antarctica]